MSPPQRTFSTETGPDGIRKRVCKACDRCRLKKSKCDGSSPCSRCKADNAICVFGERKKSHDKVYPKGYVEMLEQQQGQLVSALQELYRRSIAGQAWPGSELDETNGQPLTHDILAALNLLETRNDASGHFESFEDDCQKLQSKLLADGAPYVQRRGSFSSESDHSQQGHNRSTSNNSPTGPRAPVFKENFSFSASPSPVTQSAVPRKRRSHPPTIQSPLHQSSRLNNGQQLYQPEWQMSSLDDSGALMPSKLALQSPQLEQGLDDIEGFMGDGQWNEPASYDLGMGAFTPYPTHLTNAYGNMQAMQDFGGNGLDPMEVDFNKFIQVAT